MSRHAAGLRMCVALLIPSAVVISPLAAQTGPTATDTVHTGASAITASAVRRSIAVLAHDSMEGRTLGSRGLARAAAYVAQEFQRLGLRPIAAGFWADDTVAAWQQRFPLPGQRTLAYANAVLTLHARVQRNARDIITEEGQPIVVRHPVAFATAARFAVDTIPESKGSDRWEAWSSRKQILLLTGRHTVATVRTAKVREVFVMYLPSTDTDAATRQQVVAALVGGSNVVLIEAADSSTFARQRAAQAAQPPVVMNTFMEAATGHRYWAVAVWAPALAPLFAQMGLDLARLQADTVPQTRMIPITTLDLAMPLDEPPHPDSGVNTLGMLWGTDSLRLDRLWEPNRNQVLVVTAHLDSREPVVPGARLGNGAQDNASGVAGLLALAHAFSQPGARLRRSLLFAVTTGTAQGAAGANFLNHTHASSYAAGPFFNFTLDRIGDGPADSLLLDGLEDLNFATRPAWIAAQHPELGLSLADGGPTASASADHQAFVRHAVPSLFAHGGTHGEPGREGAADPPAAVDAELAARRLQLLYYLIRDLAMTPSWPRWRQWAPRGPSSVP